MSGCRRSTSSVLPVLDEELHDPTPVQLGRCLGSHDQFVVLFLGQELEASTRRSPERRERHVVLSELIDFIHPREVVGKGFCSVLNALACSGTLSQKRACFQSDDRGQYRTCDTESAGGHFAAVGNVHCFSFVVRIELQKLIIYYYGVYCNAKGLYEV